MKSKWVFFRRRFKNKSLKMRCFVLVTLTFTIEDAWKWTKPHIFMVIVRFHIQWWARIIRKTLFLKKQSFSHFRFFYLSLNNNYKIKPSEMKKNNTEYIKIVKTWSFFHLYETITIIIFTYQVLMFWIKKRLYAFVDCRENVHLKAKN